MLQFLEASAGADAASLVTTVTGMAGTMLSTMASNPILGIFVGVPIAGVVVGLVGPDAPSLRFSLPPSLKAFALTLHLRAGRTPFLMSE